MKQRVSLSCLCSLTSYPLCQLDANAKMNLVLSSPFAFLLLIALYCVVKKAIGTNESYDLGKKSIQLLVAMLVVGSTFFVRRLATRLCLHE